MLETKPKSSRCKPTLFHSQVNPLSFVSMSSKRQELLVLMIFASLVVTSVSDQGSIRFIYNGFKGSNLHLDGIANMHPNGLLQLTNSSSQQKGHVFCPFPLRLRDSPQFSTTFVVAMYPHLPNGGNGIAFVLSPSMDFSHALVGEFLGLFNYSSNGLPSNHVFAVELDTVDNPLFGDIDNNHVGIDVNSLISLEATPVKYYSEQEQRNLSLNLLSSKPIQVWIEYDATKSVVEVALAPLGLPKPKQLLLSTQVNLSKILLHTTYVGFSASTGTLTSDHYLLGWSFSTNGKAGKLDLSKLPSLPQVKAQEKKVSLPLIALITLLLIFLIVIAGSAYAIQRKKYEEVMEEWEEEYALQRFKYRDLYEATKGFKEKELLGAGGFGRVYRGFLSSANSEVAVKRVSHDSRQGMKEFVAEIASMRRLRHRNLVPLLGYCRRKGELLLVYEYMPNGSLDRFLFDNEKPNLSWPQRFNIIRGVASALLYLHEEWEQVVLHRDIKASNILLDADMNARLGDFGLARLYDHGTNTQTTHVVGTIGYLAPELPRTGKATTSTDVYAFGTFLLEVACGKRPLEMDCIAEHDTLLEWVFECWKRGGILEAIDPRLDESIASKEMDVVLKLGLLCSQTRPEARPSMRQVTQFLDGDDMLPEVPADCIEIDSFLNSTGTSSSFPLLSSKKYSSNHLYSSVDSVIPYGR